VRALAEGLRKRANQYRENRDIAVDVAKKLDRISAEMDDRDWQMYFRRIGERAPLTTLQPKKK
jgi:hypothetical protein